MLHALRKRISGKKGFTLIELIVVIAVIAILAVILIPRFAGFTQSARERSAMSDARNILMALEALDTEGKLDTKKDPDDILAVVVEFLGKPIQDGELIYVGKDENGIDFLYSKTVNGLPYNVYCVNGNLYEEVNPTTAPSGITIPSS